MSEMDEAKFLKKHIRTGGVDVHPTEKALVVTYHLEATILGEAGDPMLGEKKECQKIIRLKDLNEKTDVAALAKEVVEKCKLIPQSKLPEVEQLLFYLKTRREVDFGSKGNKKMQMSDENGSRSSSAGMQDSPSSSSVGEDLGDIGGDIKERATIQQLEQYIEFLYEEVPEKTRGSALILQLARNPNNLEELLQNETLLGALARVLREDWKKSLDLATNLTSIFFCFSTYTQFHSMISHFKIGALCMQVGEYELKRYELWKEDFKQKKHDRQPQEYEKSTKKLQLLVKKQDQLLRVLYYLLYHLAEDISTQAKMANRGIVDMLCQTLDRRESSADLLIVALSFLRKLSVYMENKNSMAKQKIVEKLSKLVTSKNEDVSGLVVRLLFNLSFDNELRKKISMAGLLPYVVPMIGIPNLRQSAVLLLYHISIDDESKALFTYTDCIPLAMKHLFETQPNPPAELMALLINLSLNKRNAQLIAGDDGEGLRLLMQTAFERRDLLTLKIARNIASHDGRTRSFLVDYVGNLAQAVHDYERDKNDFALEALKVLGELSIADLDFAAVLKEYDVIGWLSSKLQPGMNDDDLVLHVVILLGNVALDPKGAAVIMESGMLDKLVNLLNANCKQEDDEIVLQIIYVFYNMMFHEEIRKKVLKETQVPAYLIELMHDKNPQIRKMCDGTLDVIAEHGEEWAKKIQEEKFRWHNAQWLEMVGQGLQQQKKVTIGGRDELAFDGGEGWQDDEDDYFQRSTDLFDRPDIFNDLYGTKSDDIIDRYDDGDLEGGRPKSRMSLNHNSAGLNRSGARLNGRMDNGDIDGSDQDEIDGVIDSGDDSRYRRARNGEDRMITRPMSGRPHRVR